MPFQATHKMKIIGGLHKNAELLLEHNVSYAIGSGEHCDVILLDNGIEKEHVHLFVSKEQVDLIPDKAGVLVDGRKVEGAKLPLFDYQVVTLGEAHLAIGPADQSWPVLLPPPIADHQQETATCLDLVKVDAASNLPGKARQPSRLLRGFWWLCLWVNRVDKKMLCILSMFFFIFFLFVYDAWRCVLPAPVQGQGVTQRQRKSVLLSFFRTIGHAQEDTLVSAGLEEPSVALQTAPVTGSEDPADHIRHALEKTWGGNLTEKQMTNQSIQFKGYDEQNHTDLLLNLEQHGEGELSASGYTLSPKKKKALLSQLGDIVQVKVNAAEDMENLCKRVLEKKGVRHPEAKFAMEESTIALKGESDDSKIITTIHDIIARAFPAVKINNNIKTRYRETAQVNITGISTGNAPHIILANGTKVFPGGKVNSNCTVTQIAPDHILMNCNGKIVRKTIH